MSAPLLEVEGLSTTIGAARVVDDLRLELARGETFALLGESGCGKSMTALSLMRLLPPAGRIESGAVRLDGVDLLRLSEAEMRRVRGARLAMIFQEPQTSLNPVMRIGAQIAEAVRLHAGAAAAAVDARVLELLHAVGIPDPERRAREYPHQLSGGMKQRVMIAMALAGDPELLIADEPTTALDVTIQAQVLGLLKTLQQQSGLAVLLITHDLGVVAETAERLAVMYAGEIVETATTAAFFAAPAHPYSRMLLDSLPTADKRGARLAAIPGRVPPLDRAFTGCRFVERCPRALARCAEQLPPWHEAGAGHWVRCHLWDADQVDAATVAAPAVAEGEQAPAGEDAAPLLEVADLKVHFPIHRGVLRRVVGQVRAVDGVSLQLRPGRTLALVGESGCGKTTAGKALLQLIAPTAGSIRYQGHELAGLGHRRMRRFRKDLQIIFQDPHASMNPRMLVGDVIGEGLQALGLARTRPERLRRAAELLELVGMPGAAVERYPHEFSGGQRQRICIARALAVDPRVIVCDEPTSALDVSVQAQILNLLKDLQARLGLSYLFITHDLSVVAYLAHEVAVMYLGRVVERGRVDEILERPRHPYTRALLSAVPVADPRAERRTLRLEGDMPSPSAPPPGCHFHPRCPEARPGCALAYPEGRAVSATHRVHCLLVEAGR
ncbi:ABC transporter ATP-binding protein [Marichromatium sp. AB32]|uniref:ABC transporter ATP-binding protein n=1 Tax=Marichromatium sp. AB32 TaxID=2483363 RepID=UPI000F3FAF61|nr:ABC transporter ATP-binding protein [Marichromatium sp. AB32]RNE93522.1 ABC transporter ATP-binding protein [Marichromatium sp. AB32]